MIPDKPRISVIVPTKNSATTLEQCLVSIKRQTYDGLELIIVDNGSTDSTVEIGIKYADKVIDAGPERSAQRNRGAVESAGEYLLFIDHDMRLEPDVIEACADVSREFDAAIVPEFSFGVGFFAKARALERSCYLGDDDIEAARFFKRSVFEKVGGYDEELLAGGEDWDLHAKVLKSGCRIGRAKTIIGHDEGRITIRNVIRRRKYYGPNFALYKMKNPERAKRQFSFIRPAFLRNWKYLLRHPLLTVGFLFLKAIEFVSGMVGAKRRRA